MKIDLFDVNEFVDINGLKEITSPVLFERGGTPNPNGLTSNEIFGVNTKSRKETFAYIDLGGYFFHPHIYKIIKRVYRNVDRIVNGSLRVSIDNQGRLIQDPDGETGISFLYDNWEKIKWKVGEGMSAERVALITKTKKNMVFMNKQIVIPVFYRDILTSAKGGGEVGELNNYYVKLIRMASIIKERDMFDFSFHGTNFNIQTTIVNIYDFLKNKLDKKSGLLRKYLLGKNVDYAVRTVISAPCFVENDPKNNLVDFKHAAVPISQVCVLAYPFMLYWLRNFFERELIENKSIKLDISDSDNNYVTIDNPEAFYTDTYIKKAIDRFVKDPSSRYDKIEVPTTDKKKHYLIFQGRYTHEDGRTATIANRYLTWTDLLYMAAVDVTTDKHIMVTRYPILDNFGIFIARIRVSSTLKTTSVEVNDKIYKWYPLIDLDMTKEQVANNFIDTTCFSNSYLAGLDGDYDGDQTTNKILWTQEANDECEKVMNSKSFILSSTGKNMREIELEPIQTLYVLTKDA
jgi:hypothetical protein